MANVFQCAAIMTGFALTADGGVRLTFATNELTDVDKMTAAQYHRKYGYVLFRENEFADIDIPDTDAPDQDKTPSQRLRAAIFVLWAQQGSKGDFEAYYRKSMDAAISRVKKLLD